MRSKATVGLALLLVGSVLPAAAAGASGEGVRERYDEQDRPLVRVSEVPGEPGLRRVATWLYPAQEPGQAAVEGSSSDGELRFPVLSDPATDCGASAHNPFGYRWLEPYVATANQHAGELEAAGQTWNGETAGAPFGAVRQGEASDAGTLDGSNEIRFTDVGATSWIARTYTWFLVVDGSPTAAVESDQIYNTHHSLTTSGAGTGFDVQGVGVHELGHTLGLGHVQEDDCLTMYPSMTTAESLEARSPGDGDAIGIRSLYGPIGAEP